MKRNRDVLEETQRGALPYSTQVEIIHGLTRARATEFDTARRAAQEIFFDRSLDNCRRVNLATLLCAGNDEGVVAADWSRKVCRALLPAEDETTTTATGPLQVETVQLVANESTSVIFAAPASDGSGPTSSPVAPLAVTVPRALGERVFPGDVVLVRTATVDATGSAPDGREAATADDAFSLTTTSSLEATHMEFVALNGLYFADLEEWREAVVRNAACVTQWLAFLSSHAPGIAQLSQIHAASLGDDPQRPVFTGWARSLQLPLLLHVNKALQPALDAKTTEKLRRLILSTLRLYVNLFTRVPALVSTEYWYRSLFCEFLASPLCVIGFSTTWPTSAGTLISSTWDAIVRSLTELLDFALYQVCVGASQHMHRQHTQSPPPQGHDGTSAVPTNHPQSAALAETPAFLERRAVGAVALILHRITGVAQQHVLAQQQLLQRQGGAEGGVSAVARTSAAHANELVYHAIEGMGHSGLLHRIAEWLQQAESTLSTGTAGGGGGSGGGGGLHALLDRVCSPPSQQDVEELFALKAETVWEQMQVMRKTYTPYLSHDATRFVEAMALAAYAELYGPSARAAQALSERQLGASSLADTVRALRERRACASRVDYLSHPALRADMLLTDSLAALRHTAAYGLPVRLSLRDDDGDVDAAAASSGSTPQSEAACTTLCAMLRSTALSSPAETAVDGVTTAEGSLSVILAVRLQGRPVLFPAVLTRIERRENLNEPDRNASGVVVTATVHILRDGDLLPDFLDTSANLTEGDDWDGAPDAWLVASSQPDVAVPGDSPTAWAQRKPAPASSSYGSAHQGQRGHTRLEPPVLAEPHRLLPRGTAALSYQDLLERLTRLRGELQRLESVSASSSASSSASEAWRRVSGLWLQYFASRQSPSQVYVKSLSGSAVATLSGSSSSSGGDGKQELTRILQDTAASASFTPLQVAVLQTMSETVVSAPNRAEGGNVPSSIKVLEGSRGSGKTSVLFATGMVRGEVHRQARQEHQDSLLPIIRKATAAVKATLTQAESATSFGDLYGGGDGAVVDIPEEVASNAIQQMGEFVRLNEGLHYCTVPLLVRPYFTPAVTAGVPAAVEKQLLASPGGDPASSSALIGSNTTTVGAVLQEALIRCRKAPLTQVLLGRLASLRRLGDLCSELASDDQDEGSRLSLALLPLVMSARETAETVMAARDAVAGGASTDEEVEASSGGRGITWESYVTQRLWPDVDVHRATTDEASTPTPGVWTPAVMARKPFAPVVMPVTMHLTQLSPESRRGWMGVYREEQRDVLPLLRTHIQEVTKHVCRLFYDLVVTTAAVSQTAKYTLLTTSSYELSQGLLLPFLWAWRPLTILVDDVEAVSDSFLSVLPPANHLTVSHCPTSPSHMERSRQLPMMLLKEIEHTVSLTTAVLRERLRCSREEIQETLRQLCGNGTLHNAPFSEYALRAKRRRERDAAKAAAAAALDVDGGANEASEAPPSAMGRGVTTVTETDPAADAAARARTEEPTEPKELCFRGIVSASAVEVWTHAVPTVLGEAADDAAAHFLRRYLGSYGVTSTQVITAFPTATPTLASSGAVCLPFLGEARDVYLQECDVAIVCLSSLAMRAVSMAQRRRVRRDDRSRPWTEMQRAKEELFSQRLQYWLWHAVACARIGVMVVGSSELFTQVPLLRGLEAFALHHRCNVPLMASQRCWLPEGAESGTLALRCPAHDKCRRTATVRVDGTEKDMEVLMMDADGGRGASGAEPGSTAAPKPEGEEDEGGDGGAAAAAAAAALAARLTPSVDIRGAHDCLSLCLQPYDACERRSHACLHPCHTQRARLASMDGVHIVSGAAAGLTAGPTSATPEEAKHAHCPFPCCKPLPCGHLCAKTCGDACEPCTFVGLRELTCGQRVVSGVNSSNQEVQYEVFHHFEEAPCGSAPRVCQTLVSAPCVRCGFKMFVPCCDVTASASRARVAAGERSKNTTPEPVSEDFSLPETECVGCVGLFNKVAQEFGYPTLPVPPAVRPARRDAVNTSNAGDATDEEALSDRDVEALSESAALPRHTLSADAQAKLRAEFAKAAQKTRLRTKAEALNISCGRVSDDLDYVSFKREYTACKARLAEQAQAHENAVKASVAAWEQRLRKDIGAQVQLNAELETMLPLLVSEAEREAARQESFPF